VQANNGSQGDLDSRVRRAKVSADAYMALAMRSAAIAQIEEAVSMQPRDPQLLERLADTLYADGKIDPAVQAWRKAIEHASNNQRLQRRLQEALERVLKTNAALTASGEAIAS
jgi:tetratricopeptide (TPR) repeat protein